MSQALRFIATFAKPQTEEAVSAIITSPPPYKSTEEWTEAVECPSSLFAYRQELVPADLPHHPSQATDGPTGSPQAQALPPATPPPTQTCPNANPAPAHQPRSTQSSTPQSPGLIQRADNRDPKTPTTSNHAAGQAQTRRQHVYDVRVEAHQGQQERRGRSHDKRKIAQEHSKDRSPNSEETPRKRPRAHHVTLTDPEDSSDQSEPQNKLPRGQRHSSRVGKQVRSPSLKRYLSITTTPPCGFDGLTPPTVTPFECTPSFVDPTPLISRATDIFDPQLEATTRATRSKARQHNPPPRPPPNHPGQQATTKRPASLTSANAGVAGPSCKKPLATTTSPANRPSPPPTTTRKPQASAPARVPRPSDDRHLRAVTIRTGAHSTSLGPPPPLDHLVHLHTEHVAQLDAIALAYDKVAISLMATKQEIAQTLLRMDSTLHVKARSLIGTLGAYEAALAICPTDQQPRVANATVAELVASARCLRVPLPSNAASVTPHSSSSSSK